MHKHNTRISHTGMACSHEVRLMLCAFLLASASLQTMPSMQRLLARLTTGSHPADVEYVGPLVDALIPGPGDVNGLLTSALSDPSLLSVEPDGYDPYHGLSPAALLYENLYRQTYAWVETYLDEIIRLALLIRRGEREADAVRPDVALVDE
jgi:hypothetical protein